jgi:hypothetical protein
MAKKIKLAHFVPLVMLTSQFILGVEQILKSF